MMTINVQQVKQLLADGKLDEAKKAIEAGVKTALSPAERGAIYLDLMRGYMRIVTDLNNQYSKFLDNAVKMANQLNVEERKISDQRKLQEVKKKMKTGGSKNKS